MKNLNFFVLLILILDTNIFASSILRDEKDLSICSKVKQFSKYNCEFENEIEDIYRVSNIQTLIQKDSQNLSTLKILENVSIQVDAMFVLKRFLRDRYKHIVPWNKLAYIHHAMKSYNPRIPEIIIEEIERELKCIHDVCSEILDCELLKLQRLEAQRRLPLDIEAESRVKDDMCLYMIMNTPTAQEISDIQKNYFLTHEKKFYECMKLVEKFNSSECKTLRENGIKHIKQLEEEYDKTIKQLEEEYDKTNKQISKISISAIEKIFAAFYEIESLKFVNDFIEFLKISQDKSAKSLLKAIFLLGEALNNISVNPKNFPNWNSKDTEDILNYRSLLKYLRNAIEHPQPFQKVKYDKLFSANFNWLFKGIYSEITDINEKINEKVKQLQNRLEGSNLESFNNLIEADDLKIPNVDINTPNNKSQWHQLVKKFHWKNKGIPYLEALHRYFIHPYYKLTKATTNFSDDSSKQKIAQNILEAEAGKSKNTVQSDTQNFISIETIISQIEGLKSFIHISTGESPVDHFKKDIADKLSLYSKINSIFRNLDTNIENDKFLNKISTQPKFRVFWYSYDSLRERRNFNTHDFWREDLEGTLNTAHCLIVDMMPILSSLEKKTKTTSLNEFSKNLIEGLSKNNLTLDQVKVFIKLCNVDVNIIDSRQWSLLHYAIQNDNFELAKFFLQNGANPHSFDYKFRRPIHIAAEHGNKDIINLLLEYKALPNVKDFSGQTPDTYAKNNEHLEISRFLKQKIGLFRNLQADAVHSAIALMDRKSIDNFIKEGKNINLLNRDGETPLIVSLQVEHSDTNFQIEIIKKLVSAGAEVYRQQVLGLQYPLHVVVEYFDNLDLIKFFIEKKINLNVVDNLRSTPLHVATRVSHYNACQTLLQNDSEINIEDDIYGSPLISAVDITKPSPIIVNLFLQYGADPKTKNKYGSALDFAKQKNNREIVKLLLQYGADS